MTPEKPNGLSNFHEKIPEREHGRNLGKKNEMYGGPGVGGVKFGMKRFLHENVLG